MASFFPTTTAGQIEESRYRRILETADTACRELRYVARLTPLRVLFSAIGLYWRQTMPAPRDDEDDEIIVAGPGRVEELQSGRLVDARLSHHGLGEVIRQPFKIPVIVYDLIGRAVQAPWPNVWKGVMYDVLGMCIAGGQDLVLIHSTHLDFWK